MLEIILHIKDIKNLSEIKAIFAQSHKKSAFFLEFISILKLGKLHAVFSKTKLKGISLLSLIRLLLAFPFIQQTSVYSVEYDKIYLSCEKSLHRTQVRRNFMNMGSRYTKINFRISIISNGLLRWHYVYPFRFFYLSLKRTQ